MYIRNIDDQYAKLTLPETTKDGAVSPSATTRKLLIDGRKRQPTI